MIISPKHKFIFFKPMKTAGSSIEYALLQAAGPKVLCTGSKSSPSDSSSSTEDYTQKNNINSLGDFLFHSHTTPETFWNDIKNKFMYSAFKSISMTRNPWDTCVSYFWFTMKGNSAITERNARFAFERFLLLNRWGSSPITPNPYLTRDCSAIQYISEINEACIHPNIDGFIRFEHLEKDYQTILKSLKAQTFPLEKFKSNYRKLDKHYSWYYSDQSIQMVEDHFPKTINEFKYKFEKR